MNDLPAIEAFHNTFLYFVEGLNVMASDAETQKEAIGGAHVAWELHQDVLDTGRGVLNCAGSFLIESERSDIAAFLEEVEGLPAEARDSVDHALNHPDWQVLRVGAAALLTRLDRPIRLNHVFFGQ